MGCKGSFHFLLLLAWPSGSFFRVWSCLCEESIVITSDYNRLTFLKKRGGMREGSSKKNLWFFSCCDREDIGYCS